MGNSLKFFFEDPCGHFDARVLRKQLRQAKHIVEVLPHVFRVHGLTLLFPCAKLQPRDGFQRDQAILSNPWQTGHNAPPSHDEVVVVGIQQDRGQTGYGLIQRDGRQLATLGDFESI